MNITNKLGFKLISLSLLVFNIIALPKVLISKKNNQTINLASAISLSDTTNHKVMDVKTAPKPTKPLYINIGFGDISITDSVYDEGSKQLLVPKNSVAWLTASPKINQTGATLLYGHNSKDIFANLVKMPTNEVVILTGEDGRTYRYKKIKSEEVKPSDTDILYNLENRKEDLITLTCSLDYFNSKRILSYFEREN